MSEKDGGPAFPGEKSERFGQPNDCNEGMSLRDYFAGQALVGMMLNDCLRPGNSMEMQHAAMRLYEMADAMLQARDPKEEKP